MISAFVATGILIGVGLAGGPGDPYRDAVRALVLPAPDQLRRAPVQLRPPVRGRSRPGRVRASVARSGSGSTSSCSACLFWGRVLAPISAQPAPPAAGGRGRATRVADMFSIYVAGRRLARTCRRGPASSSAGASWPGACWTAGPSVLAVGRAQRRLAPVDDQGGRRPHRTAALARPGHPGLRRRAVGRLHRRPPDPPPGPAHRRRQRHRADPRTAGGPAPRARS